MNNPKENLYSSSPEETKKIAEKVLKKIKETKRRSSAAVIALEGDLGAGKTNFTQGVAEYAGIKRNVTSPTFVLMKRYNIKKENRDSAVFNEIGKLYHLDCYRIRSAQEILELGWDSIISEPGNIVIVEWAERIKNIIPSDAVWITINNKENNRREFIIKY